MSPVFRLTPELPLFLSLLSLLFLVLDLFVPSAISVSTDQAL